MGPHDPEAQTQPQSPGLDLSDVVEPVSRLMPEFSDKIETAFTDEKFVRDAMEALTSSSERERDVRFVMALEYLAMAQHSVRVVSGNFALVYFFRSLRSDDRRRECVRSLVDLYGPVSTKLPEGDSLPAHHLLTLMYTPLTPERERMLANIANGLSLRYEFPEDFDFEELSTELNNKCRALRSTGIASGQFERALNFERKHGNFRDPGNIHVACCEMLDQFGVSEETQGGVTTQSLEMDIFDDLTAEIRHEEYDPPSKVIELNIENAGLVTGRVVGVTRVWFGEYGYEVREIQADSIDQVLHVGGYLDAMYNVSYYLDVASKISDSFESGSADVPQIEMDESADVPQVVIEHFNQIACALYVMSEMNHRVAEISGNEFQENLGQIVRVLAEVKERQEPIAYDTLEMTSDKNGTTIRLGDCITLKRDKNWDFLPETINVPTHDGEIDVLAIKSGSVTLTTADGGETELEVFSVVGSSVPVFRAASPEDVVKIAGLNLETVLDDVRERLAAEIIGSLDEAAVRVPVQNPDPEMHFDVEAAEAADVSAENVLTEALGGSGKVRVADRKLFGLLDVSIVRFWQEHKGGKGDDLRMMMVKGSAGRRYSEEERRFFQDLGKFEDEIIGACDRASLYLYGSLRDLGAQREFLEKIGLWGEVKRLLKEHGYIDLYQASLKEPPAYAKAVLEDLNRRMSESDTNLCIVLDDSLQYTTDEVWGLLAEIETSPFGPGGGLQLIINSGEAADVLSEVPVVASRRSGPEAALERFRERVEQIESLMDKIGDDYLSKAKELEFRNCREMLAWIQEKVRPGTESQNRAQVILANIAWAALQDSFGRYAMFMRAGNATHERVKMLRLHDMKSPKYIIHVSSCELERLWDVLNESDRNYLQELALKPASEIKAEPPQILVNLGVLNEDGEWSDLRYHAGIIKYLVGNDILVQDPDESGTGDGLYGWVSVKAGDQEYVNDVVRWLNLRDVI